VQIEIDTKLKIELTTSSLSEIITKFSQILLEFFFQFISAVLLSFADHHPIQGDLFECKKCGARNKFDWKTRNGKKTLHSDAVWKAADDSTKEFFADISQNSKLISLIDFGTRRHFSRESTGVINSVV
jgi:hypothetical protein